MSIAFQQCVGEEDWVIVHLKLCKSRSLSRNQPQKLDMSSNANNFANPNWNATKIPPKEAKVQELSNNMQI